MEQLYTARSAFKDDANHAIAVMSALVGAMGFLFYQGIAPQDGLSPVKGWAALCFLLAFGSSVVAVRAAAIYIDKLSAGYSMYAAAAGHATILWRAAGLEPTHVWQKDAIACSETKATFFGNDNWGSDMIGVTLQHSVLTIRQAQRNYCFVYPTPSKGKSCDEASQNDLEPRFAKSVNEVVAIWMGRTGTQLYYHKASLRRVMYVGVCMGAMAAGAAGFCVRSSIVAADRANAWGDFNDALPFAFYGCGAGLLIAAIVTPRWFHRA